MPNFRLDTNVPREKIPADFLAKTTALMAETLGKPQNYCIAQVLPDLLMSWGGTNEPCASGRLLSIGKLGVEENRKHAAVLTDHIEKTLGIKKERICLEFVDADPAVVGYNGTTFHEIFGK